MSQQPVCVAAEELALTFACLEPAQSSERLPSASHLPTTTKQQPTFSHHLPRANSLLVPSTLRCLPSLSIVSPTYYISEPDKMGDVLVENPANLASIKKPAPSTIPAIDNFEGIATDTGDDYADLKKLQRQLEYIQLQEEYIKDEQRSLKRELVRAQEEIKRIQSVPLVIGQFMEAIDQK